ncbi:MAG TPA: 50S ribosomal protein L25 [Terriglobales bacterium]|jgi:large subunit ribosomal protein L25|nr:50S ribosomal protein L25 [Terriglobales bacterium]
MAKTESNVIEAKPRQADGKNVARRARRAGQLPAVVYGARKEPVTVALDPKQITRILHSETGHNTILDLQLEGERTKAMIVDWQYEPLKGSLLHIDLKRIAMDQLLRVKVPIHLKGEAPGVKQQGGIMEQVLREVELECLPADIPSHIDADVSGLLFNQVLRVADLSNNEGRLRLLSDGNQVVAHIVTVKEVVEATPDAAAAEAGAAAEPEVIKKGKQDEEGTAAPEKK